VKTEASKRSTLSRARPFPTPKSWEGPYHKKVALWAIGQAGSRHKPMARRKFCTDCACSKRPAFSFEAGKARKKRTPVGPLWPNVKTPTAARMRRGNSFQTPRLFALGTVLLPNRGQTRPEQIDGRSSRPPLSREISGELRAGIIRLVVIAVTRDGAKLGVFGN